MKFDIEKALAGEPVMLRNGDKAFVRHHETELDALYPLSGYCEGAEKYVSATWTEDGHAYSNPGMESDGDIVSMWIEPAVFNHWDALNPKWKFIAADEDGDVYVFTTEPGKRGEFWANGRGEFMGVTDLFNFQYTDWEHSLVERPSEELS